MQYNTVIREIPVSRIRQKVNIRTGKNDVSGLVDTISEWGLQELIKVWEVGENDYVLVNGSRRLAAFKKLKKETITAQVIVGAEFNEKDFLLMNAIENLQRKDITQSELGRVCSDLKERGLKIAEIALQLCISKGRVRESIMLYEKMPKEFRDDVVFGAGKGRKVVGIGTAVARKILSERKFRNISDAVAKKLFRFVKSNDISSFELGVILQLVKMKTPVEKALVDYKKYGKVELKFVCLEKEMEKAVKKYGLARGQVIRKMLAGEIPLDEVHIR